MCTPSTDDLEWPLKDIAAIFKPINLYAVSQKRTNIVTL